MVASNKAGEGYSSWGYGRTREGGKNIMVHAPLKMERTMFSSCHGLLFFININ